MLLYEKILPFICETVPGLFSLKSVIISHIIEIITYILVGKFGKKTSKTLEKL